VKGIGTETAGSARVALAEVRSVSAAPRRPGRPPRVALDIGVFGARGIPSTYGGYETFLTAMLPQLVARGHRVTVYCRRGEVPAAGSYRGVRCVVLPAVGSKQLSTLTHGYVAAARAVAAGHDVLLVVNVANAAASLACRLLGRPVVLNTDGQEWLRPKWGRVARGVFLLSAYLARWGATALLTDSVGMHDIYRSRFRARSTVIPYPWTEIVPRDRGVLAALGVERRGYFVVAGRLVPENNIDRMAAAYLATTLPYPLVVLGTANYRSPVSARLNELSRGDSRLILAGHVEDRSRFAFLLAEARAYIHGHSVGGINPSLIEAMGSGARILALDTPFNREALAGCGDYFRDPALDLGLALDRHPVEPGVVHEKRRAAARARALSRFRLGAVADAYEDLLASVADGTLGRGGWVDTAWAHADAPVIHGVAAEATEAAGAGGGRAHPSASLTPSTKQL
jgi:glycosyltransferase involved in cell wall biosynthesis